MMSVGEWKGGTNMYQNMTLWLIVGLLLGLALGITLTLLVVYVGLNMEDKKHVYSKTHYR